MSAVSVTSPVSPVGAMTLPARLGERAATKPTKVALRKKHLGRWKQYTWLDYQRRTETIALGLLALGVQPGDRVAIDADNRPAWVFADLATQGIGAVSVGIYPTSPAPEVEYVLGHSESVVLIAEDEEQLDKAMAVAHRLPALRKIVIVDPRGVRQLDHPLVMTLAELEALGDERRRANDSRDEWRERVEAIDPAAMAIIVYTSGTTGPPKGAMLSHINLLAAASSFRQVFDVRSDDEVLSYLPLCHIAERLGSVINAIEAGYVVNFGEGGEAFVTDLNEVQPTYFLGVPRVWEKMMATIQIRMADASGLKRGTYRFWMARGERLAPKRMSGRMNPLDRLVAGVGWLFLYRSLRAKLGMGRVRVAVSGAAPIAPQILGFFWTLGIPVREGYGQTEGTAVATYTPANDIRIGKVGTAVPGAEVRVAPDGEILVRGPAVFLGYFKDAEATSDAVDGDGWLHTGDMGELDSDGFLTITDRKKDIIITSGGKNISPSEIENRLKLSPYVREAVVIGDRRKYLTALIGIEADTVGDWATRRGIAFTTYRDLSAKTEVNALIADWVAEVNRELAQVETIKRFELLPKELDAEEGELTATQKVKRAAIAREFGELIEGMYV
jgi:long-chain acyl-CoA synthetase